MAARELEAFDALRDAEKLLVNHRAFVRSRPQSADNAEEHERVSQALHRTREAIAHLAALASVVTRCTSCGYLEGWSGIATNAAGRVVCFHCGAPKP